MAKKAATNSIKKFEDDVVGSSIVSKYGHIIESGDVVLNNLKELKVISFSPALDLALGGGLREGSCVVVTGDPKLGKTTCTLHFAAKAQKAGKTVVYVNTEGRLTKENFTGIKGLDPSLIKIIQATDEKPLVSAETYLNAIESYIKGTPELVIIVDSVSNMVPQEELEGEIRTGIRNSLPRLLSQFFKRISGDVARMKTIAIFITHNIANTGGSRFAPQKMSDCGNMIQYQAGTNMVITHRGKWVASGAAGEDDKNSEPDIGQIAYFNVKTSAAGGIPNSKADVWIRYGVGIDEAQEISQIATEFSLIRKKGAWYEILAGSQNKSDPVVQSLLMKNSIDLEDDEAISKFFTFQGISKVTDFLRENEDFTDLLYSQIKEMSK